MGVNSLLKTVTRQRRDCDLNRAFCAWVQHANHSATESPLYVTNTIYKALRKNWLASQITEKPRAELWIFAQDADIGQYYNGWVIPARSMTDDA